MPDNRLAFVFPAFTGDFTNPPGKNIPGFEEQFNTFLQTAARTVEPAFSDFSLDNLTAPQNELQTQYLTYIYSCTVSVILRKNNILPSFTAGYSMGIYAALFDAGVVSFEAGLELIRVAYHAMYASLKNYQFGMGTVIGLDRDDIQRLISHAGLRVEIANQNASHSFVVSGFYEDLINFLDLSRVAGALHVRNLTVSIPYHSRFLKVGALEFERKISHIRFASPKSGIISLIDQTILVSGDSLRSEVIRNLFHALNWYNTTRIMVEQHVGIFVECGASKDLVKNAKFVVGDYRFYTFDSMQPVP